MSSSSVFPKVRAALGLLAAAYKCCRGCQRGRAPTAEPPVPPCRCLQGLRVLLIDCDGPAVDQTKRTLELELGYAGGPLEGSWGALGRLQAAPTLDRTL